MAEKKKLSRRDFLLAAAGAAGAATLAACQPKTVIVKETVEVEVEKEVTKVVKEVVKETVVVAGTPEVVEKEVTKIVEVEKEVEVTRIVEVPKEAEIEGTFWVLQNKDYFPSFNEWFRQKMVDYCKERGWPLDISYVAGYTGGTPTYEKVIASVEAGQPADLVYKSLSVTILRQAQALEVVTDVMDTVIEKWGDPAARQWNDYYTDDAWWEVPYFQRSDGGWYQKPVFDDAGIDLAEIRQYTDLLEACLEVTDPDNELYGWGVTINRCGDGDWWRNRMEVGYGAWTQDETGQYVVFDSPEMVEAMTIMTNYYMDEKYKPMLPPGVLAWTDMSNNEAYLAGKLAYTQNGGTVYGKAVIDENPVKDVTRFHTPCGGPVTQEFNSLSATAWLILRGARNWAAAKETILEFMLPLENMDQGLAAAPGYALPAYDKLWDESVYAPTNPVVMDQKAVATDKLGIVPGQYPGPPMNPALSSIGESGIENDMVADILRGTPVAQAVKTAHDRMVKIFKDFDLPGEK
jgi:multiple sugar transport system substrate-binding protein